MSTASLLPSRSSFLVRGLLFLVRLLLLFLAWQRDKLEALAGESPVEVVVVEERIEPLIP